MISSLAWMPRGRAKAVPSKYEPTDAEMAQMRKEARMLGAAMPVLGIAGLVAPPLAAAGFVVRIFFLIAFWNAARATLAYRARFTPNPCARCLPKTFPFCDGNRARLASLFKEFEQSAGPEDADFIAFASAITNTPSMVSIETIQLEDFQT